MLKYNVENCSKEQHDEVELSRRSFFSRLALGTVLSISIPGVVNAAKSTSVKADNNHRLEARSTKRAVRLPKRNAIQSANPRQQVNKISIHHASSQPQKALADQDNKLIKAGKHNTASNRPSHTQTAHDNHRMLHNTRIRDVYTGKQRGIHTVSNHVGHNYDRGSRERSIIQPLQKSPILDLPQDSLFLANQGHLVSHRSLAFQNPHTGDKLSLTYFEKGRYITDALDEISFLLRDYRTGDVHPIDPELLDQLHDLKQMLGLNQPFGVICGYRSPLTNARLHAEHSGVANNSFHIHGRAVDIRIERFDLRRIHNAALAIHRGGVGYYPESNFIHLDTGTFRTWTL